MLRDIPLFSELNEQELSDLDLLAVRKMYPKNTVLFTEGDPADSLYVICSGKIKVTVSDEEGREVILSLLGAGEYFGEMALLDSEPRSACVITKEPTTVLIFSKNDFMNIFSKKPIASHLLKGFSKRLRDANKKIEDLALLDVYGRIARLLCQMADIGEDGKRVVSERLTHQEISNMIGASREMVSIIMKELSNGGYISVENKIITIEKDLPYSW